MNRRGFLASAGAAVPVAAWAAQGLDAGLPDLPNADLPLQAPSLRVALLHSDVAAIDSRFAAGDRAALLTRWLQDVERLCSAKFKPDVILLPDFALTGWDHWTTGQLAAVAARLDGPEIEYLGEAASRSGTHILLGGWWRTAAADPTPQHQMVLLSPLLGPQTLSAGILRTPIGNWTVSDSALDDAAEGALMRAGAEWLVVRGVGAPSGSDRPLLRVTLGRATHTLPPGCPAVIGDEPPFQSRAVGADQQLLACSVGHRRQTLMFTAPIGALRAARLRAATRAPAAGHILG